MLLLKMKLSIEMKGAGEKNQAERCRSAISFSRPAVVEMVDNDVELTSLLGTQTKA